MLAKFEICYIYYNCTYHCISASEVGISTITLPQDVLDNVTD
jgi:hypothetical protein